MTWPWENNYRTLLSAMLFSTKQYLSLPLPFYSCPVLLLLLLLLNRQSQKKTQGCQIDRSAGQAKT